MKRFKASKEPVPVPTMPQISNQGLPVIGRHVVPQSLPENISHNQTFKDRLNHKFNISNTSMQSNNVAPTQVMPGIPPIPPPIPSKPKQKWACVEERIQNGLEYGSVIRKIIFGDLYKNPTDTVPAENNFNVGDTVYYFDEKKKNLLRGTFITSHSQTQNTNSKFLVVELLQTENAVEFFCKQYSVSYSTRLSMVIEAYTYLAKMIQTPTISNTHVPPAHSITATKPMIFSQPVKSGFMPSNFYDHSSSNTLLIEEQDASPERVEDDHTVEEIEFDADEDDDDISLAPPSNAETTESSTTMKLQDDKGAEKDDNFFVQQKTAGSEEIDNMDDIAPGDSGGTKKNLVIHHNSNQSNVYDSNESFVCAKCDQKLVEPPPNSNLKVGRIEVFRNVYAHPKTCSSCPNGMIINAQRLQLAFYDDSAKLQECKKCPTEINCTNKTANICFGCSIPWCKKLNPLVCHKCASEY